MARKRANGEGTIRKRADGSWEARYMVDGKRHSVYGRSQAEVRKKLTEVSVTIDHGDYREDSGLTLGQWLTMWHRDYLGNVKLGTADTYEMQIRVHIVPALGDVKLSALRTPMIQRLYNKKREEGLSPKSIKNIHGCLHKALDVAVRIGYLSKNPSSNCILPRIEQAEIHPLDTPELSKLLAFLKGHEHEALIVTAIFTGLRSGELLGLTWDSVDFENGLIRVTKQLAQPRKKGEVFRFATPKNSKPRTIAPQAPHHRSRSYGLPGAEEAQGRAGSTAESAGAGMERWRLPQPGVHASGWQPPVPADRMEDSSQDPGGSGYRRAPLPRSETHLCGQFHYGGG